MAIQNRTRDLIERSLRPGSQSAEIITALNNAALTTVLSQDALGKLKKHVSERIGNQLFTMLQNGGKMTVTAAQAQDAYLKQALFNWLKDRDAANDVFNQIATVV